ncbi:MAG: lysozyme, partial [Prevotellaceae bacterium]|nr:lysozyme [Prevotellaceae bacterium]
TDFVFNLGIARLKGSTLLRYITLGKPTEDIQREFNRWVYCKGQKLKGLVIRRAWEADRWAE